LVESSFGKQKQAKWGPSRKSEEKVEWAIEKAKRGAEGLIDAKGKIFVKLRGVLKQNECTKKECRSQNGGSTGKETII